MKKIAFSLSVVFVALIAVALLQPVAAQTHFITDLGTLGGTEGFAYAINDLGQVVGYSRYSGDTYSGPVLWSQGAIADLNAVYGIGPGDYASMAEDTNNLGQIAGNSSIGHAVILSKGATTDLITSGGTYSRALGVNDSGQVVGYYTSPYGYNHAFLYSNGVMTGLGPSGARAISVAFAINDSGMIVGTATNSYRVPSHAFLYSNGVMTDISPFGNSESYARGINNSGQAVGEFLTEDRTAFHCFLYDERGIADLGTLGGPDCTASAINGQGEIVGSSPVQAGLWHGFLYKNENMIDINTLIQPDSGWELKGAFDINSKGQIVGYGTKDDVDGVYRAFLLTPYDTIIVDTVQKLYMGYYQRPADPEGLRYWVNALTAIDTNHDGNFVDENILPVLAHFAYSEESRALYGGAITSSNIATVIDSIYVGLFGRHAEAEGLSWWVNSFNTGASTPATILWQLVNAAQGADAQTLQNKLAAAGRFTRIVDPNLDGNPPFDRRYAGYADCEAARQWLSQVTWDPATIPTEEQTRAFLPTP